MNFKASEKIRYVLIKQNVSNGELAERTGQSRQNLSNKLTRDKFTTQELEEIAVALGVTFDACFIMPNGERV